MARVGEGLARTVTPTCREVAVSVTAVRLREKARPAPLVESPPSAGFPFDAAVEPMPFLSRPFERTA